MPRPAPTEATDFPVYRVQAKCPCGREGWTGAFKSYPEGTIISTRCSACVDQHQERVAQFQHDRVKVLRKPEPKREPREHKPHWTDNIP